MLRSTITLHFRGILLNPFIVGLLMQSAALLLYMLNWSSLFPPIPPAYIIWFCIYAGIAMVFSFAFRPGPITNEHSPPIHGITNIFILMVSLFVVDVLISGTPPAIQLTLGTYTFSKAGLKDYGVALVHPILLSCATLVFILASEWAVSSPKFRTKFIIYSVCSLALMIVMLSRGTISIAVLAYLFSAIRRHGHTKRFYIGSLLMVLILFIGFGYIGDIRTGGPNGILLLAGATQEFINSGIPNFLFWIYIYAASPLANFCLNIAAYPDISSYFPEPFVLLELIPDLITKRMDLHDLLLPRESLLITPSLTVSTSLCFSYLTMGWVGVIIKTIYDFTLISLILKAAKKLNWIYPPIHAILVVAIVLSAFDNMTTFSGILIPCGLLFLIPNRRIKFGLPLRKRELGEQ